MKRIPLNNRVQRASFLALYCVLMGAGAVLLAPFMFVYCLWKGVSDQTIRECVSERVNDVKAMLN